MNTNYPKVEESGISPESSKKRIHHLYYDLSGRIESIDIFRGLTILVMIFVNDLASVKGLPWWMEHMPENVNGMTFVDVVFPAFLYIVGMAIPLAVSKRLEKEDSILIIWKHILIRTVGLLVLGVLMVNISDLNEQAAGINREVWMFLVFVGAILTWNIYPKVMGKAKILFILLRLTGIALLIFLAVIYKSGSVSDPGWLHTKWWGILGLIGWAYLFACLTYFLVKGNFWGMVGGLIFFYLIYVIDSAGAFNFAKPFLLVGEHIGVHTAIVISGLIVSMIILKDSPAKSSKDKIIWITIFSAALFLAGVILSPFYGVSKIYATPAWGLYSAAYCGWIFALLYWFVDLKKNISWGKFLKPAGKNPLLAYILPDIYYSIAMIFGFTFLNKNFGEGIPGLVRSIIFAFIMIELTALFNKMKIRLHL
jgi:predicted acyltransferase